MVKISILYPDSPGTHFDFNYYAQTHMPRAIELLSRYPGYRGVSVERGIGGPAPGTVAAYIAMCHFSFDSVDAFMAAFLQHAAELKDDVPNYTNIASTIQISEVVISGN